MRNASFCYPAIRGVRRNHPWHQGSKICMLLDAMYFPTGPSSDPNDLKTVSNAANTLVPKMEAQKLEKLFFHLKMKYDKHFFSIYQA